MTRRTTIADLTAIVVPEQPALSPDGTTVAYVRRSVDGDGDRTVRALWAVDAEEGAPRQLTRGSADSAPAWRPDGSALAFLRADGGAAQLHLLPTAGGEAERLTTLPLGAGPAVWSPDGSRIAFTAPVDLHASAGDDDAARQRRATAPTVTARLDYQADGAGMLRTIRQHVHVIDLAAGKTRQVTEGDWHAGTPAWSPDGTTLVFAAATAADSDLTPAAPLYTVDTTDPHARPRQLGPDTLVAAGACYTADGAAVIACANPDGPTGHIRLLRITVADGSVTDLTADLDRNVMPGGPGYPGALPQLHAEGDRVALCIRDQGCTYLVDMPSHGGEVRRLVAGDGELVSGMSVAGNRAAVVLGTASSYGEIAVIDLADGSRSVRTDLGAPLADAELFARTPRQFTLADGTEIHGWLITDPAVVGPRPLLLDIHGGPHNAWNGAADEAHLYHQQLAADGWAVLLVNPRGSDGYGEEFYNAVVAGWGTSDARDFLEPVEQLVAEGVADPERLAVTGYSYGGYMTCYLTSRDGRFAAAVPGGVVADLTSMVGTSDAGHFLSQYELGGQPWIGGSEIAEAFAAMSPLSRVDQVRTPTLVVHGEADMRCPVGQAQQWFTALRERDVPTELALYPGGSHLFILQGKPSHRLDWNTRVVEWVQRYAGIPRTTAGAAVAPARLDRGHWQRRLETLAERHQVPGAALGIFRLAADPSGTAGGDDEIHAATGVLNKDTGVAATTDSLFQIGSMSKVWTTTVVMQLVDEGLLDLDAPLTAVLPELALADPEAQRSVTMRRLLTHTSGIDGDIFDDTGRGDDCLEKYTALLADAAQNHPIGATWSYCNAGFSLAGRVIEKLTGLTWDAAMREKLYGPLGLDHAVTLPEDALLYSTAVGHVEDGDGGWKRAPIAMLPRSLGPAGLITASVGDVLRFARMHLTGGLASDGTRVLSAASTDAMAAHQVDLPDKHSLGDSWGLGWIRFDWAGHRLIGHDGNTIGQSAFLRLLPEAGLAVTLLTNGGHGRDLYEDLYREIFAELADVEMAHPLTPPAEAVTADITPHLGTYERAGSRLEVVAGTDGPVLRSTVTGPLAALLDDATEELPMIPLQDDLYLVRAPGAQTYAPVTFYALPSGERYLHFGVRATPKKD